MPPKESELCEVEFRTADGQKITKLSTMDVITEFAEVFDFVKVVRCKDCKWFNRIGCAIRIVDDSDKPTEMDYCSFGEMREDG